MIDINRISQSYEEEEKSLEKLQQYLNDRLQEGEECFFVSFEFFFKKNCQTTTATELKQVTKTCKVEKITTFLAFVRKRDEYGILFFRVRDGTLKVEEFLALKNHSKLVLVRENEFQLFFELKKYHFVYLTNNTFWRAVTQLTNSIRITSESTKKVSSTKLKNLHVFEWMKKYEKKKWDQFVLQSVIVASASERRGEGDDGESQKSNLREEWIERIMKKRSDEYTTVKKIKVCVGIWNVDCKFEKQPENLRRWLHSEQEQDVFAIGFQEVDMSATALLREETEAFTKWNKILKQTFKGMKHTYQMLASKQLVGLYIAVFIKSKLLNNVSDVKVQAVGCGALGTMGNKGGVAVRFQFCESTLCFMSSHLAAHHGAVKKRNQNQKYLEDNVNFHENPKNYNCKVHDIFFWFGDLNYRLNISYEEAIKLIKKNKVKEMLKHDQLSCEKRGKRVFFDYEEDKITFLPTYKFDPGTNNYDTSKKKRVPSYTDRIQWKKSKFVKPLLYTSHKDYFMSDHKPVVGIYEVGIKEIVVNKYKKVYSNCLKMLDNAENNTRPILKFSKKEVNFEDVKYLVSKTRKIVLTNKGEVVCEFKFVPKVADNPVTQTWLTITPLSGLLIPDEKIEIKFTVLIDYRTAPRFNGGEDKIDDILVLRLKNGSDHFINIRGNYLVSCVGHSLTKLAKYSKSIKEEVKPVSSGKPQLVPKEIWFICDYLYKNCMDEPQLFLEGGDEEEVEVIRELLDKGKDLGSFKGSHHSVAQTLITLLVNLEDSVIPRKFHQLCITLGKDRKCKIEKFYKDVLSYIPPEHFNAFQYLLSFFRELLKPKYQNNELTQDKLAILVSRILMPPPLDKKFYSLQNSENREKGKISFIIKFFDYNYSTGLQEFVKLMEEIKK